MSSRAISLVQRLQRIPENSRCADCLDSRPEWASSKLGIFICLNCSGIHRSLGTHISFVRSCKLDQWTDDQAAVMRAIGNKVANNYWEYNLPANFQRPNSNNRAQMENFIRRKYVDREFARPNCKAPNELPLSKLKGLTDDQINQLIEESARAESQNGQNGLDFDDNDLLDQINFSSKTSDLNKPIPAKSKPEYSQSYGSCNEFPKQNNTEIQQPTQKQSDFSDKLKKGVQDVFNVIGDKFTVIKNYTTEQIKSFNLNFGDSSNNQPKEVKTKSEDTPKLDPLSQNFDLGFDENPNEQFDFLYEGKTENVQQAKEQSEPFEIEQNEEEENKLDFGVEKDDKEKEFDFLFDEKPIKITKKEKNPEEKPNKKNEENNDEDFDSFFDKPSEKESSKAKSYQNELESTKKQKIVKEEDFDFLFEDSDDKKTSNPKEIENDEALELDFAKEEKKNTIKDDDFDFLFEESPKPEKKERNKC